MPKHYVAIDLGGSRGRIVLGKMVNTKLEIREVHRFAIMPLRAKQTLYSDVLRMWEEIKTGLRRASLECGAELDGIGVSTWAQDFALLDRCGELVDLPFFYRDRRDPSILDYLHTYFSESDLYQITGITDYAASTLCQLLGIKLNAPGILDAADKLLLLPSVFLYWLSGCQVNESTSAGVSQVYDLDGSCWSEEILLRLELPSRIFPEVVPSGSVLGSLLPKVAKETSLNRAPVIAAACHDTAAAVAAVPALEARFVFISSGTWSIIGTELASPLRTANVLRKSFLNELGVDDTVILAYNSAGFWLLQECYRAWSHAGLRTDYPNLLQAATMSPSLNAIVDPNSPCFFSPDDMVAEITEYCRFTGQEPPITPRDFTQAIFESLALCYRKAIQDLEELTGWSTDRIHMIGGGAKSMTLCQMTADATGKTVIAGPVEATSAGAIALQAMAQNEISSLRQLRETISFSNTLAYYRPKGHSAWDDAYDRFLALARLNL